MKGIRQSSLTREEKEKYTDKVKELLADIYYDTDFVPYDKLLEISLFLYKYNDLGPKGTKEVAKDLYNIYYAIKKETEKRPKFLVDFKEKMGYPLSLEDIEFGWHIAICINATPIARKIQQECVNTTFIDLWIRKKCLKKTSELIYENDEDLNQFFKNYYNEDIANYLNVGDVGESYRHLKQVEAFVKNYKNKPEFILRNKAKATIERLEALKNMTNNKDEITTRIKWIYGAIKMDDDEMLRQRIMNAENYFYNKTRR